MPDDRQEKRETEKDSGVPYAEDFSLRGMLGQGGIGRVYLGFDRRIGREVAIKEPIAEKLGANRERVLARFVREARISGQLEHPGIVPVYELRQKPDGTFFYVMKRVQGRRLKEAVEHCAAATPEQELRLRLALLPSFISVCEAVGYAHARGIIHRDLKPENIILGEFGEAVILDWGLAKRVGEEEPSDEAHDPLPHPEPGSIEDEAESLKTLHGARLGTPSVMAPEQVDPRYGEVGLCSDVYALGAVLFYVLTGDKPYHGTPHEIMDAVARPAPSPSPRALAPLIPAELAAICEKAMSKHPQDRFPDAAALAAELRAWRDGRLVSVYAYTRWELFARFVARNKLAIGATLAVILSIMAGAGIAVDFAREAHAARARAERALADVTMLSGAAMQLASDGAVEAETFFARLVTDLEEAVKKPLPPGRASEVQRRFDALGRKHPEVAAWLVVDASGRIQQAFPEGVRELLAPLQLEGEMNLEEVFGQQRSAAGDLLTTMGSSHTFVVGVPIRRGGRTVGALAALLQAEKAMPAALAFDPRTSPYQIWCMRDDGFIIYDEDPNQIGRFLFTDAMYAHFPELQALGERIRDEESGLGYYAFKELEGKAVIQKIAAWHPFRMADRTDLKLVVAYPYRSH